MSLTSEDVLAEFQRSCDENKKLFVPTDTSASIADNLIKHYSKFETEELLIEAIEYFVKNGGMAITIFDFAVASSRILENVKRDNNAKEELRQLMKQTEERMHDLSEL